MKQIKRILICLFAGCMLTACAGTGGQTSENDNNELDKGVSAIEDAMGAGGSDNQKTEVKDREDLREGTSRDTVATPEDFPDAYNYGTGKISDYSRSAMLRKMPEPEGNQTVLNTTADPEWLKEGSLPPTFYVYGTEDPFYDQFEEQYQVIEDMGIKTGRIVLDGWPHGFGSDGGWVQDYAKWLEEIFQ